jgi:hypothetical protein
VPTEALADKVMVVVVDVPKLAVTVGTPFGDQLVPVFQSADLGWRARIRCPAE